MFNEFGGEQSHKNQGEQDSFPLTLHCQNQVMILTNNKFIITLSNRNRENNH